MGFNPELEHDELVLKLHPFSSTESLTVDHPALVTDYIGYIGVSLSHALLTKLHSSRVILQKVTITQLISK